MGRLIDADALIEWINEQREKVTKKQVAGTSQSIFTREDLVAMQRCLSTFETKINNQPTAYDVEKVKDALKNHPNVFQESHYYYIPLENAVEVVQSNDGKGWWNECKKRADY